MNSILRRALYAATAILCCAAGYQPANAAPVQTRADKQSSTYSPEVNSGRDSLRQIVQSGCMVHWSEKQDPAPCERLFLPNRNGSNGYALLADRKGGAHFLLIPTKTMTGLESADVLDNDAPNYFAAAWQARDLITRYVGHPVQRTAVGLAVNTANSRGQDQFHVHIECLRQDVVEALRTSAQTIGEGWAPVQIGASTYQGTRVMGISLDGTNPYELLAKLKPGVRNQIGIYTLIVAGMQFKEGAGFAVLTGTGPTGELLLDSSCSAAGAGG